jgi:hypothetical protein
MMRPLVECHNYYSGAEAVPECRQNSASGVALPLGTCIAVFAKFSCLQP